MIKILDVSINQSYLSKVKCDAPRHCCQNGDQGCEGRCIPELWTNDNEKDCDDGSDEKSTCNVLCTKPYMKT
jgi:hypothetical protein